MKTSKRSVLGIILIFVVTASANWTGLLHGSPPSVGPAGSFQRSQRQALKNDMATYDLQQKIAENKVLSDIIQQNGALACDSVLPSARRHGLELQRTIMMFRTCLEYNKMKEKK